jgi:hypothetical protein
LAGATIRDWVLLTARVAFPERLLVRSVAVIMVVPAVTDVAKPFEPVMLLTIATSVFDEVQSTADDQFNVVPSVNLAMAINCSVVPVAKVALAGVTVIELMVPPCRQLIKPSNTAKGTARTKIYDLKVFIRVVSLISLTCRTRTGQWGIFCRIA